MSRVQEWVNGLRTSVRLVRSELPAIDTRDVKAAVEQLTQSIPPPPSDLLQGMLSLDLLDLAHHVARTLHEREDARPCSCPLVCWSHVRSFTAWREIDPRVAFRDYVEALMGAFEREHPAGIAQRAAWMIQSDPARAWTLSDLATALSVRPIRLRREFLRRFGLRPSAYLQLIRASRSLALLATVSKVEAVAREVGFRSKKDLYRVLARWVGGMPTEIRTLPHEERTWLERQLKIRWVHGIRAGARHPVHSRVSAIAVAREPSDTRLSLR